MGWMAWGLSIAATLAAGVVFGAITPGEVAVYPTTAGIEASSDYRVWVNGEEVFVYRTPACSTAMFGVAGECEVAVEVQREIKKAVVRPLSRGIEPVAERNEVRFRIEEPCQLALEVDEDLRRPLFLFANPIERNPPRSGQRGVKYFEGGRIHEAGRIELRSGETIYLAGGAVVRGVIRAEGAVGARILGPGILDASTVTRQTKTVLLDRCSDVEIDGLVVAGSYGWSVVPRRSQNVRISNMKVIGWRDNDDGCDPDSSRHVVIDRCFFRTQDDCIAVKSHDNADVAGMPPARDPSVFNTEDVRVSNCVLWNSELGHALTVGFAIRGPMVRNVVFSHCDVIKQKGKLPALSVDNHDLGIVEGVRFEDIRIEEGCERLLAVKVAFSQYSADCPAEYYRNNPARKKAEGAEWEKVVEAKRSSRRGAVRDVVLKNIQVIGAQTPLVEIRGWSKRNEIDGVRFENVTVGGKELRSLDELHLRATNATGISFAERQR